MPSLNPMYSQSVSQRLRHLGTACLLLAVSLPAVSQTLSERLQGCVKETDDTQRLACYDRVSATLSGATENPSPVPVPVPEAPAPAAPQSVAQPAPAAAPASAAAASVGKTAEDEVGGYQFRDKETTPEEAEEEAVALRARVVQCQRERGSGSWYFRLDNDQIWKQTDRRRLNFIDCDFDVRILDGGFGYEMRIDGRDGKIRVSRRQ
ncbi:hypothetical protein [Parahalioglobus pacificus]|uniref:hypothetical protein n=1 Tax=Parahalioglobus pacificus TaxID=930806 RepID=UPI001677A67F|nr:hypothetical protein [Halioglobus pacificus]